MEYSHSVSEYFRGTLGIHPEDSINLAKVYQEYHFEPKHGKYGTKVEKGKKMIWIGFCEAEQEYTIWSDDVLIPEGTVWHCLFCGHEKQPPVDPNFPDKNIPVQPVIPIGSMK
jgi:hypothetical protein